MSSGTQQAQDTPGLTGLVWRLQSQCDLSTGVPVLYIASEAQWPIAGTTF
jgi:hypothetical protein